MDPAAEHEAQICQEQLVHLSELVYVALFRKNVLQNVWKETVEN